MTQLDTLLASLIALTSFAACSTLVEDGNQDSDGGAPIVRLADYDRAVDLVDVNAIPDDLEYVELADIDANGQSGGACACDTDECFKAYVIDTYGCGICVDVVCNGELTGGCYSCDGGANQLASSLAQDYAVVTPATRR